MRFSISTLLLGNQNLYWNVGLAMGVFFCDSLDPCYDPCHVIKHELKHKILSMKKSHVMIHVYA